ncbi:MAG: hypothetical protein KJ638_04600, partial [Chloroflexi bacterium]|nr:hypothetical protein [Chloroflexota bacterium]
MKINRLIWFVVMHESASYPGGKCTLPDFTPLPHLEFFFRKTIAPPAKTNPSKPAANTPSGTLLMDFDDPEKWTNSIAVGT